MELLSPAGSLKSMRFAFAFAYAADAVYAGQPRYSLRVRNNEFSKAEVMAEAITEAHAAGKKFYLASNISPHNDKIKTYLRDIRPIIEMQPDALIMSDQGLIMLIRENWLEMPIHLSVQANAVNWATVKFGYLQGEIMDVAPGSVHTMKISIPMESVPRQSLLIRYLESDSASC